MGKYKLYDIEHDRTMEFELTNEQFAEFKRFLKDLKEPPKTDFKGILDEYNRVCRNLPPATRLTDKRRQGIAKLLKSGYDTSELFKKAAESPFLSGKNTQKWHASFDWLIIPSNALKVIEGNYTPATPMIQQSYTPMSGNPFDEYGEE